MFIHLNKSSILSALVLFFIAGSCNSIQTGNTLSKKTTQLISSLGMLDKNEQIIFFYSNYKKSKAGSFITNKRIGHYWLGALKEKSDTSFALYSDIVAIDTVPVVADLDCPYMQVRKNDSTVFRAYVNGSPQQKTDFFKKAIELWKAAEKPK